MSICNKINMLVKLNFYLTFFSKSNDESVDASEMTRLLSRNVISRGYRVSGIELYSDCQLVNGKFRRCITADKTGITEPERYQYRRVYKVFGVVKYNSEWL